jgi:tetratricopeptide (TPR) repeat protein
LKPSGLDKAIRLREEGNYKEARIFLLDLQSKNPNDALVVFNCAVVHDNLGLEAEAIPFYLKAIDLGLSGKDLKRAILGLGGSYRCLKQYDNSLAVLEDGVCRFPDNWSIKVFLAMTYHECGRHGAAMELLLKCTAETSTDKTIDEYRRAITFYATTFANREITERFAKESTV